MYNVLRNLLCICTMDTQGVHTSAKRAEDAEYDQNLT